MQAEKRHEVQALMSEAHKQADSVAVSVLTREVKRLMRGRAGAPAEVRAANVQSALALVEAAVRLMEAEEKVAGQEPLFKAEALLSEAVEAGEPESKYTKADDKVHGTEHPDSVAHLAQTPVEASFAAI